MPVVEEAARSLGSACEVREATPADAVDGVPAGLVAMPEDTQQVGEVLRAAAGHRLTVVPRGCGTKMTWGLPPTSADVVVDLIRMHRVLDHQSGDLIVEVQAGAPLGSVQETVGQAGQRLVLDETVAGASIGGTLATNASGPQRMLAGSARDLLIGVTVVRADGIVAKAGGRVVKNVAGYDLGKLVIGSFGTLAVITEAVFRLHPVPEESRFVVVPVDGAAQAHRLAQAVVHSQTVPAAVQVDLLADGSGTVAVLLGGRASAVEERARAVAALLGSGASVLTDRPAAWSAYPWGEGDLGLKLTCVLSGVQEVLETAASVGARVRGSAGAGVLYAALPEPSGEAAVEALARLREVCQRRGGAAVVVDGPRHLRTSLDVWGPVPALDLMRRVKDQFDPDHRLAPGRFVGEI